MNAGVRKDTEVGARQLGAEAFHTQGASQGSRTEGGGAAREGAGDKSSCSTFRDPEIRDPQDFKAA